MNISDMRKKMFKKIKELGLEPKAEASKMNMVVSLCKVLNRIDTVVSNATYESQPVIKVQITDLQAVPVIVKKLKDIAVLVDNDLYAL